MPLTIMPTVYIGVAVILLVCSQELFAQSVSATHGPLVVVADGRDVACVRRIAGDQIPASLQR